MLEQKQLTLSLLSKPNLAFSNFYVESANEPLIYHLKEQLSYDFGTLTFIWGNQSSGKTHLLNAMGESFHQQKQSLFYFSCADHITLNPSLLDHLEKLDAVLIDDINLLDASPSWQEALFHLLNRLQTHGQSKCIITSQCTLHNLQLLADIKSRLSAGTVYHLHDLTEQGLIKALKLRAKQQGLELTDSAITYILSRSRRDAQTLFEQFDHLDQAAWRQQRKLTVPFIKSIMQW